jgi:hypothetical protein
LRLCRLAESPVGQLLPLAKHRRPQAIRAISRPPIFGRDYYQVLADAKIVLNGAIDMAGTDRGNMRCFEVLGPAPCFCRTGAIIRKAWRTAKRS